MKDLIRVRREAIVDAPAWWSAAWTSIVVRSGPTDCEFYVCSLAVDTSPFEGGHLVNREDQLKDPDLIKLVQQYLFEKDILRAA